MSSTHLVFLDSAVDHSEHLATGIIPDATLVVLDANRDGIAQITEVLANIQGISSLHIVSHGDPGQVYLGTAQLNLRTLDDYAESIQAWANSLTEQAEILLYGCRAGLGTIGTAFIQQLSTLTRATIAASTTLTGSSALGGHWHLDKQTGLIQSALAFKEETLAAYPATLDPAFPNLLYGTVNNSDGIFVVDPTTGALSQVGTLAFSSVAIARSTSGFIYYIEDVPFNGQVGAWDPITGQNSPPLGNTGATVPRFLKLAQDQVGFIFGLDSTSTILYFFDPTEDTINAQPVGNIFSPPGTPVAEQFTAGTGDIAFDINDQNRLFVLVGGAPTNVTRLFTVDLDLFSPTFLQATFIANTGMPANGVGSLAFGEDGFLYATAGGFLYRMDPNVGIATQIAQTTLNGTPVNVGDFATLPVATPQVDIQVAKADGLSSVAPGTPITYTITVTNLESILDLNGISLVDTISADILNPSWSVTFETPGGVTIPDPADRSGTGNIDVTFGLTAQSTVVYTVTGTVAPNAVIGTLLNNSATATVPPGILDPNPSTNTSTDSTTIGPTTNRNEPPTVTNSTIGGITPGGIVPVTGLTGTDPDGSVASFTIQTLPPAEQGTLFLGNPTAGGSPVTQGQVLTPAQVPQLFFQAAPGFTTSLFTYSATDNLGSPSVIPGTVNLTPTAIGGGNQPPIVTDVTIGGGLNTLVPIPIPPGVDPDGTIATYTITSVPDPSQGIIYIGDPNSGGIPVQPGQVLTPSQVNQLVLLTTGDFINTSFTYVATDNGGLTSAPATVRLTVIDDLTVECEVGVNRKGNAARNKLRGTPGADTLIGLGGNDVLKGRPCDDLLRAGKGNDRAFGGRDRDTLYGNQGNDILKGGSGRDIVRGGLGADLLRGNDGSDFLRGGRSRDRLFGGRNPDVIQGNLGNDRIGGNGGEDIINAGAGSDAVKGGPKADEIRGGGRRDTLGGGNGDDFIVANAGRDRVLGGRGDDIILAGIGADVVWGKAGDDLIEGDRGNDTLRGGGGSDLLLGFSKRDFLGGGGGDDELFGQGGRDRLAGRKGNDLLIGGGNRDRLNGGPGLDEIEGGRGRDTLLGGKGADTFVYSRIERKRDRILDFVVGKDVIDLSQIFTSPDFSDPNPFDRYIRLRRVGAGTAVQIDANGDGAGQAFKTLVILKTIAPGSLDANSFLA